MATFLSLQKVLSSSTVPVLLCSSCVICNFYASPFKFSIHLRHFMQVPKPLPESGVHPWSNHLWLERERSLVQFAKHVGRAAKSSTLSFLHFTDIMSVDYELSTSVDFSPTKKHRPRFFSFSCSSCSCKICIRLEIDN